MIVIIVSLMSAVVQMGLLLLTARVIGVVQYTRFSLIVAIAVFVSSIISEWLRMIVARHSGSRRLRFRGAVLRQARSLTFAIAAGVTTIALAAGAVIAGVGTAATAQFVTAIGVAAAGIMLSDMSAVLLRYGVARQTYYIVYTIARVAIMGGASLCIALRGANGPMVATAFGIAGMVLGGSYAVLLWPRDGRARPGLLRRLSGQGWSLAAGSIGSSLAMTLARLTLGVGLPAAMAGSALLSTDLYTRGSNVLGSSLSNWGNRNVLQAAHDGGMASARAAFRRFSAVFGSVWFSAGLLGLVASLIIPVITLHVQRIGLHLALALPTLVATALLNVRIFLFDGLLAATNRHREVALIAVLTATSAGACALSAALAHNQTAAALLFPIALTALTVVYAIRNFAVFSPAIDWQAARFALEKTVVYGVAGTALVVYPNAITLGVVVVLVLSLDTRQALRLLATLRPRAVDVCAAHRAGATLIRQDPTQSLQSFNHEPDV